MIRSAVDGDRHSEVFGFGSILVLPVEFVVVLAGFVALPLTAEIALEVFEVIDAVSRHVVAVGAVDIRLGPGGDDATVLSTAAGQYSAQHPAFAPHAARGVVPRW